MRRGPVLEIRPRRTRTCGVSVMTLALSGLLATPAAGQSSVSDVLSFLLTNRSVQTADFKQDENAAAATRDSISKLLLTELATVPISSSAGGFSYRLNPALGTLERSTDSFGPFFTERSLTAGAQRASVGIAFQAASFDDIEGRNLRDGSLVAIAGTVHGAAQPFDVETLTLRIDTRTVTLSANYGVTDRLDIGAALPFITIGLSGERIDTYRGSRFPQATASITASGVGDVLVRAKYNVYRGEGKGLAFGGESRLPTGDPQNLLGTGRATIKPLIIGSVEGRRATLHADAGYSLGGLGRELDYAAALTAIANRRVTLIGELNGRRLESLGRLTYITEPHPGLVDIDTIRLSSVAEGGHRIVAVAGFKWNVAATWLVSANVIHNVTSAGLNARWTPT